MKSIKGKKMFSSKIVNHVHESFFSHKNNNIITYTMHSSHRQNAVMSSYFLNIFRAAKNEKSRSILISVGKKPSLEFT